MLTNKMDLGKKIEYNLAKPIVKIKMLIILVTL